MRFEPWLCLSLVLMCSRAQTADEITVIVEDKTPIQNVGTSFHGINIVALWNSTNDHPDAVKAFSLMGMDFVRFPGGVPAEWYDWKDPLASGWTKFTPEKIWAMAQAGRSRMIFQTNIATMKTETKNGRTYSFNNTGDYVGEWAAFCLEKKIDVAFWEIGNEPELDAPKEFKKGDQAVYDWYNMKFAEHAQAIKKVDPKAKTIGPASTNTWFWWHQHNIKKFLKAHGNKQGSGLADAISVHWYPNGGAGPWEKKRGIAQGWEACMKYLREAIAEFDSRPLPVYITEWNWGAGDKNDSGSMMSNALGCADCIGMFLRTGIGGHTHFCLQKIKRGWGVLAMKKGENVPENTPSPTYFALALASHMEGEVFAVQNNADEKNLLSAYATRSDSGLWVMLINKGAVPLSVKIGFQSVSPKGKIAHVFTLEPLNGSVYDTDVIMNGVKSPRPSSPDGLPKPQEVGVKDDTFVQELNSFSMAVICFK